MMTRKHARSTPELMPPAHRKAIQAMHPIMRKRSITQGSVWSFDPKFEICLLWG